MKRGTSGATALGFLAILLWSVTIPLSRSVIEQLGPFTTGALVHLAGALLLAGLSAAGGGPVRPRGGSAVYVGACGGLFVAYFLCLQVALGLAADRRQAIEVGLVNYLWPSLTVLLAVPILRLPANRFLAREPSAWGLHPLLEAAAITAASAFAYRCWDLAMRRGNVRRVATAAYFTPLLSTLAGCAYLGVAPRPRLWAGCAILVAASFLRHAGMNGGRAD